MQYRCLIYILALFTNKMHIFTFPAIQLEWNTLFRRLTTNQVCDVIRNMNKLFLTFLSLDCCVLSWSPYRICSVQRFSITIEWYVCVFFLIIAAAISLSRLNRTFCVFNHSIQLLDFTNTISLYKWIVHKDGKSGRIFKEILFAWSFVIVNTTKPLEVDANSHKCKMWSILPSVIYRCIVLLIPSLCSCVLWSHSQEG